MHICSSLRRLESLRVPLAFPLFIFVILFSKSEKTWLPHPQYICSIPLYVTDFPTTPAVSLAPSHVAVSKGREGRAREETGEKEGLGPLGSRCLCSLPPLPRLSGPQPLLVRPLWGTQPSAAPASAYSLLLASRRVSFFSFCFMIF